MTTIDVEVVLGTEGLLWSGQIQVPRSLIEPCEETLGEFEVLDMPSHDDHHSGGAMTPLPTFGGALPSFLVAPSERTSAPNVVGNIGEGLGVATFMHLTGIALPDVTRVRRQKSTMADEAKRTPDFIASLTGTGASTLAIQRLVDRAGAHQHYAAVPQLANFPVRFPLEAKGSTERTYALWSAIWQLIEYWHTVFLHSPTSPEIGYGVVLLVHGIASVTRKVTVHVLAPAARAPFISSLNPLPQARGARRPSCNSSTETPLSDARLLFDRLRRIESLARWAGDAGTAGALADCRLLVTASVGALVAMRVDSLASFWRALAHGQLSRVTAAATLADLRDDAWTRRSRAHLVEMERKKPIRGALAADVRSLDDEVGRRFSAERPGRIDLRTAAQFQGQTRTTELSTDQWSLVVGDILKRKRNAEPLSAARWEDLQRLARVADQIGAIWLYSRSPATHVRVSGYSLRGAFAASTESTPSRIVTEDGARVDIAVEVDDLVSRLVGLPRAGMVRGTALSRLAGDLQDTTLESLGKVLLREFRPIEPS